MRSVFSLLELHKYNFLYNMTDNIFHFFQLFQLIVHTIFCGILDTSIGNNKVSNIYNIIYKTVCALQINVMYLWEL